MQRYVQVVSLWGKKQQFFEPSLRHYNSVSYWTVIERQSHWWVSRWMKCIYFTFPWHLASESMLPPLSAPRLLRFCATMDEQSPCLRCLNAGSCFETNEKKSHILPLIWWDHHKNQPPLYSLHFLILLKTAKNILISYLNIISERIFKMHSMYKHDT